MIERRNGSVVTISSDAAVTISAASPAYAAAKSGVLTLTRYVAAEAAPYGVHKPCPQGKQEPSTRCGALLLVRPEH
jgi:NAD(P)-dependent dehydrogenase (short-subunit alcohol dehydrogenase family)